MRVSRTPRYPVALVEQLVRDRRVLTTARVTQWLTNHDYDAKQAIMQVLLSVREHGRFTGTCTLMNGESADEYIVGVSGEDWYLKFWVDEDELFVDVWSCCWDGAIH